MKRRHAIVIGLVGVAVAAIVFWPRAPRPCLATFQRVQPGMTRDEVYKTVGGPPGDYTGGTVAITVTTKAEFWASSDAMMFVSFDDDGRAKDVGAAPAMNHYSPRPSIWKRFLVWLGI